MWPRLLGMAFPEMAGKPLLIQLALVSHFALSKMESGVSGLFTVVEYCAGFGNLSRSFLRRGCTAASLDKKYGDSHDALSSSGLRMWLLCLLHRAPGAFLGSPLNAAASSL